VFRAVHGSNVLDQLMAFFSFHVRCHHHGRVCGLSAMLPGLKSMALGRCLGRLLQLSDRLP
jgi:hypothetical protein